MGSSKKHKKHKSERREKYDGAPDRQFCLERPPGLKLIFKVGGSNSTPEYGGNDSPSAHFNTTIMDPLQMAGGSGMAMQPDTVEFSGNEYPEKPKKSKKKKKKKDREKRHKHHHKEKRRHRGDDSSQEDMSIGEDSSQLQESILKYAGMTAANSLANSPVTKPMIPFKSPMPELSDVEQEHHSVYTMRPESASPMVAERSPFPPPSQKSSDYLKSPGSDSSGREPRTCVLKQKQSRSPLSKLLDHLLRALEKKDPHQFFAWPVTDDIAPGYSSIISEPMDFLSIRQKVDENEYSTLLEFSDDFRLMCENAIKYNHVDTVYHQAAKKLLHIGGKMLQPNQLLRSLRPLMMYMRALTPRELGFDLAQTEHQHEQDPLNLDSADEGMSTGAEEVPTAQQEEDEKRKNIRRTNNPTSRFGPYVDDLTAEEVLSQVQSAAKTARSRVLARRNAAQMGFLNQNKDGTTSMNIIVDNTNDCPERVVSIGAFTGKLQQGTGQLQGFREDRRNTAKVVKPINYGTFCSFAPMYDSRFANLSKEESELVLNTYGDETGSEYACSIMDFSRDSSYASTLANGLLDILTHGEHRKAIGQLMDSQYHRFEQSEIDRSFPSATATCSDETDDQSTQINFESLRTLADIGVNVSFLSGMEHSMRTAELTKKLHAQLQNNSHLIERLQQVQTERLSQPLPQHLAHIARPSSDEIELANQLTTNLTEMAKQLPPDTITNPHSLRKAMGLTNVGLEPMLPHTDTAHGPVSSRSAPSPIIIKSSSDVIDTTPVPMDLEPEVTTTRSVSNTATGQTPASTATVSQVDIENELREFLESGSAGTLGTSNDNESMVLDQMMMH